MISSIQSKPRVLATPRARAMNVPMRAATMPTTMVSQIGMFCLPGTTRRPSAPMMRPMMRAVMMPVALTVPPRGKFCCIRGPEVPGGFTAQTDLFLGRPLGVTGVGGRQGGDERLLRHLDAAHHLHPLLAFLLLLEQLALAGDVTAVALGQHVLADRPNRLAGDDPAADGRLDRHLELLPRNEFLQLGSDRH